MDFKKLEFRQEADVVSLISRGLHARAPAAGRESGTESKDPFLV